MTKQLSLELLHNPLAVRPERRRISAEVEGSSSVSFDFAASQLRSGRTDEGQVSPKEGYARSLLKKRIMTCLITCTILSIGNAQLSASTYVPCPKFQQIKVHGHVYGAFVLYGGPYEAYFFGGNSHNPPPYRFAKAEVNIHQMLVCYYDVHGHSQLPLADFLPLNCRVDQRTGDRFICS